jgi:nitroreductase/NAD-dependent dihydropyrimidine dehydrogenase PreA subunit
LPFLFVGDYIKYNPTGFRGYESNPGWIEGEGMSFIRIDTQKCKRDGFCAAVCPGKLIEIEGDRFPAPIPEAEQFCIRCGHCLAVCPRGALSLEGMEVKECLPIRKERTITPDQGEQFLKARRSIRTFKDKPVPRPLLAKAIDIARYAPSGGNTQPVHWLVIEDGQEVKHLAQMVVDWQRTLLHQGTEASLRIRMERLVRAWDAGVDRILRDAPHLVVAHGPVSLPASESSCLIALTYLELAAFAVGLGTCWAGYFMTAVRSHPPLLRALDLPPGHLPYGAMMIGYPRYRYRRIPLRKEPPIRWKGRKEGI